MPWSIVRSINLTGSVRVYWRIYRGPGFLTVIWFSSSPQPLYPSPVSKLPLFLSLPVCRWSNLLNGRGMGEEPNHTASRKPGPLSLNTLCVQHTVFDYHIFIYEVAHNNTVTTNVVFSFWYIAKSCRTVELPKTCFSRTGATWQTPQARWAKYQQIFCDFGFFFLTKV
jgi:hypothetical protein